MIGGTAVAAAAAILYACLAAGGLSKKGGLQRQFGVECMVCYSTHDRVISVLEGPNAILDAEGIPARVNR